MSKKKDTISIERKDLLSFAVIAALILALILTLVFCIRKINSLSGELDAQKHNFAVYSDTLRYVEEGDYYEKLALVINENNELKEYNRELYENVTKLKRKLLEGSNISMVVRDTIILKDTVRVNVKSRGNYHYNDEWVDLGLDFYNDYDSVNKQTVLSMNKLDYSICTPIETYLTDDLSVIVKSPNPNVVITDIKSFVSRDIMDNAKPYSKSAIGLHAGLGLGVGYNPADRKMSPTIGLVIGIGYNYNFKLFRKH